jgi:hypothetical protein
MLVRRVFIDLKHYLYAGKKSFYRFTTLLVCWYEEFLIDLKHFLYSGKKSFYRFTTLLVC